MPVDQTGENVLFVIDGPTVEAHIQIQYDPRTNAENFAWVIPVSAIPELSIGSDPLFQALLAGSVPSYGLTTTSACQGDPGGDGGGFPPGGFISAPDGGGANFEPEVVLHEVIGALEVTVLSGGSATELVAWLDDNGYQQDPKALPILEEYVQNGWMFAAVKLAHQSGFDQIHPLVLRYTGVEACVPLKLTRIAAQDDMAVRTFFLGDDRVAPTNYDHVLVNPLKLDWLNQADNYTEVITLAVDEAGANGKAWVTEYAGPSNVLSSVYSDAWDPSVFLTIDPTEVMDQLTAWDLGLCGTDFTGGCTFPHPLMPALVREFLPVPDGVDEAAFYECLSCYADQIDMTAWDGDAFAAAFAARIVDPAFHADELLTTWPYLTRMFTTISPNEMTVDPIFHVHPDLPEVDNRNQFAVQAQHCDSSSAVTLPDGRVVFIPAGGDWPDFQAEMPWVEDVTEIPDARVPPIPTIDNTETIDTLLASYNQSQGWPPSGGAGDGGDGTGTGTSGEWGDGGTASGADTDAGAGGGQGGGEETAGCGCTSGESPAPGWLGLVGLVAGAGLRRRRRV
jgi:MYXO-CTERM domain-containing protein